VHPRLARPVFAAVRPSAWTNLRDRSAVRRRYRVTSDQPICHLDDKGFTQYSETEGHNRSRIARRVGYSPTAIMKMITHLRTQTGRRLLSATHPPVPGADSDQRTKSHD
jgi:hypothetical protein